MLSIFVQSNAKSYYLEMPVSLITVKAGRHDHIWQENKAITQKIKKQALKTDRRWSIISGAGRSRALAFPAKPGGFVFLAYWSLPNGYVLTKVDKLKKEIE